MTPAIPSPIRRGRMLAGRAVVAAVVTSCVLVVVPISPVWAQVPEPDRLVYAADVELQVLSLDVQDPTSIQVAPDGRVIWVEREGAINVLNLDGSQVEVARLPVTADSCNDCVAKNHEGLFLGGIMSLLLAQDFADSGRLYVYWSVAGSKDPATGFGKWRLSSFELGDHNVLDPGSEKVIFETPADFANPDHWGANLEWLPDGTLLLSTGDNIPAALGGYGPRDPRGRAGNGELSVQNPADLRGKILRMMPDGSLPDGSQPGVAANPFVGQFGTNPYIPDVYGVPGDGLIPYNPYIYAMGFKQPWRGAVDPRTGTYYIGDVGPDALTDDPNRGPAGREEINVVPLGGGGNYGWPRCVANNLPYIDYDYETGTSYDPLDCSKMVGSVIHYQKTGSQEWPITGASFNTSIPAAVYPQDARGALALPDRFDGDLLYGDFRRGFIYSVPIAANGALNTDWTSWEWLMAPGVVIPAFVSGIIGGPVADTRRVPSPQASTAGPLDMTVGPDGAVYIADYGNGNYNNASSRITRFVCAVCIPDAADYGLPVGSPVDYGMSAQPGADLAVTEQAATAFPLLPIAFLSGLTAAGTLRRRRTA